MEKHGYPNQIFIYVSDEEADGTPVFGVARELDDISENIDGDLIAVYTIKRTGELKVRRELD